VWACGEACALGRSEVLGDAARNFHLAQITDCHRQLADRLWQGLWDGITLTQRSKSSMRRTWNLPRVLRSRP